MSNHLVNDFEKMRILPCAKWMITNGTGYKMFHFSHFFVSFFRCGCCCYCCSCCCYVYRNSFFIIHHSHSCVNITKLDTQKKRTKHSFHLICAHIFMKVFHWKSMQRGIQNTQVIARRKKKHKSHNLRRDPSYATLYTAKYGKHTKTEKIHVRIKSRWWK